MNNIAVIAAYSSNRVIGNKGKIPWDIPDDRKRFRELTTGNVVIMGRKTYEGIGHPLLERSTIVVSSGAVYESDTCRTAGSLGEAVMMAGNRKIFVAGGQKLYEEAILTAGILYITEIDAVIEGDTYFPEIDADVYERTVEKSFDGKLPYRYVTYRRK